MGESGNKTCEKCGGDITPDEIVQRTAGLVGGVLLCPNCVELKRRVALQARAGASQTESPAVATARRTAATDEPDEVISLVGGDEMPGSKSHMIRSFAEGSTLSGAHHDEKLKRPLTGPAEAATRCRTFHAKLTDAGLANMDDNMNEWLDSHHDVFIKSATSSIGVFEGKSKEPHLFLTVFY